METHVSVWTTPTSSTTEARDLKLRKKTSSWLKMQMVDVDGADDVLMCFISRLKPQGSTHSPLTPSGLKQRRRINRKWGWRTSQVGRRVMVKWIKREMATDVWINISVEEALWYVIFCDSVTVQLNYS